MYERSKPRSANAGGFFFQCTGHSDKFVYRHTSTVAFCVKFADLGPSWTPASHYVSIGVDELDQEKLTPLLRVKYHNSIADAVADLGRPEEISKVFVGFQRFLY